MTVRTLIFTTSACVVLGGVGWLAFHAATSPPAVPGSAAAAPAPQVQANAVSTPSASAVAPASDIVSSVRPDLDASASPVQPTSSVASVPATAPSVRPDLNANVASVAEAVRTGRFPERLSPLMAPNPFNATAYAANPQAYLDIVEPGRVFQSAEPGLNMPVLSPKGTASYEIPVGGACTLAVVTTPRMPVTFTALDLGTFPNSLTSITVQADAAGEASTVYSASGGVIADAQVLAGSPGASGQVKFHVFVTTPPVAISAKP
jgi:hypothetical protein